MRAARFLAAAVLTAVAAGCASGSWLQGGFDESKNANNPSETGVTSANVDQLEAAWSASVSGEAIGTVVKDGVAYVRSESAVTALDIATGTQRWSRFTFGEADTPMTGRGIPAIVGDILHVPVSGTGCYLVDLDIATGDVLDARKYNYPELTVPPGWGGGCYAGDILQVNGSVILPWHFDAISQGPENGCPDQAWFISVGIRVYKLDGTVDWGGPRPQSANGCRSDPPSALRPHTTASSDGVAAYALQGQTLTAYPLAGCQTPGCSLWTLNLGEEIRTPPVPLANGDVVVSRFNKVSVVDDTSHTVRWSSSDLYSTLIAATDTTLFVSDYGGRVNAFPVAGCGSATCSPTWRSSAHTSFPGRVGIGGDVVYLGEYDGTVQAMSVDGCGQPDCPALWSSSLGSRVTAAPVIVDGTLVVGTSEGVITAFRISA